MKIVTMVARGALLALAHQCQVALMQRAHGRHHGDLVARRMPVGDLGAQCGQIADQRAGLARSLCLGLQA